MAGISSQDRFRRAGRTVVAMLIAMTALVSAAAAEAAKDGTARYKYKVTQFDYSATGDVVGGYSEGACAAGTDASWIGHAQTAPADLSPLGKFGEASLRIGNHGTSGLIKADLPVENDFTNAEHTLTTECNGDGLHPGQQTDYTTTSCTDHSEQEAQVYATIDGGVGDRVKVDWSVGQPGGWLPDAFSCVQPFEFVHDTKPCKTKSPLSRFTAKKVSLKFLCMAQTLSPPVGQLANTYFASSVVTGSVKLKRTKQS
jgi:hypothetical protein